MDNDRVFADYIKGTTICAVKKDGSAFYTMRCA